MTLEQLRVFVAVAERLHVTRAAAALNITQSSASAAIQALETSLDTKLFNRVGRHIELTEAGRVFLPEARAITPPSRDSMESVSAEKLLPLVTAIGPTLAAQDDAAEFEYGLELLLDGFADAMTRAGRKV